MNQLQLSECVFAINSRIQPDGCGSPISRIFLGEVRGNLPNSLDRSLDWKYLMENRWQAHLRRVERKGIYALRIHFQLERKFKFKIFSLNFGTEKQFLRGSEFQQMVR